MEENTVCEEVVVEKPCPVLLRPIPSKIAYTVIGLASAAVLALLLAMILLN